MDHATSGPHTLFELQHRLRGGAATTVTIKPRIQKDKWSLYWKESMETKTEALEEVRLELSAGATVGEIHKALQNRFQWTAPEQCERLEGFKDPWDVAIYKGRELPPSTDIGRLSLGDKEAIICIRRVLIPEVWKVIEEGQEEEDMSSDEDW